MTDVSDYKKRLAIVEAEIAARRIRAQAEAEVQAAAQVAAFNERKQNNSPRFKDVAEALARLLRDSISCRHA